MEGHAVTWSAFALLLYRRIRSESFRARLRAFVIAREGGPTQSRTIREILRRSQKVDIGLHTRWPHTQKPGVFHPGTHIGRYCSIADTVRTFTRNHPMNVKSTHGFFENPALGFAKADLMDFGQLHIGNGVTIGHNAVVLRPTETIGEGALIAPGSVIYSNIPPYAVVSGFPARVTGYRFPKEVIARLLESRWGEKTPAELETLAPDLLRQTDAVAPAPAAAPPPPTPSAA